MDSSYSDETVPIQADAVRLALEEMDKNIEANAKEARIRSNESNTTVAQWCRETEEGRNNKLQRDSYLKSKAEFLSVLRDVSDLGATIAPDTTEQGSDEEEEEEDFGIREDGELEPTELGKQVTSNKDAIINAILSKDTFDALKNNVYSFLRGNKTKDFPEFNITDNDGLDTYFKDNLLKSHPADPKDYVYIGRIDDAILSDIFRSARKGSTIPDSELAMMIKAYKQLLYYFYILRILYGIFKTPRGTLISSRAQTTKLVKVLIILRLDYSASLVEYENKYRTYILGDKNQSNQHILFDYTLPAITTDGNNNFKWNTIYPFEKSDVDVLTNLTSSGYAYVKTVNESTPHRDLYNIKRLSLMFNFLDSSQSPPTIMDIPIPEAMVTDSGVIGSLRLVGARVDLNRQLSDDDNNKEPVSTQNSKVSTIDTTPSDTTSGVAKDVRINIPTGVSPVERKETIGRADTLLSDIQSWSPSEILSDSDIEVNTRRYNTYQSSVDDMMATLTNIQSQTQDSIDIERISSLNKSLSGTLWDRNNTLTSMEETYFKMLAKDVDTNDQKINKDVDAATSPSESLETKQRDIREAEGLNAANTEKVSAMSNALSSISSLIGSSVGLLGAGVGIVGTGASSLATRLTSLKNMVSKRRMVVDKESQRLASIPSPSGSSVSGASSLPSAILQETDIFQTREEQRLERLNIQFFAPSGFKVTVFAGTPSLDKITDADQTTLQSSIFLAKTKAEYEAYDKAYADRSSIFDSKTKEEFDRRVKTLLPVSIFDCKTKEEYETLQRSGDKMNLIHANLPYIKHELHEILYPSKPATPETDKSIKELLSSNPFFVSSFMAQPSSPSSSPPPPSSSSSTSSLWNMFQSKKPEEKGTGEQKSVDIGNESEDDDDGFRAI